MRKSSSTEGAAELVKEGLVTVREAAIFLKMGVTTVYNLMNAGRLGYCKIGRARRIPRGELVRVAAEMYRGGDADGDRAS